MENNLSTIHFSHFHGIDTVRKWVKNLKYFYFYQSRGGVFDDNGQSFYLPIKCFDRNDLIRKLETLGIEIKTIPEGSPKPEKGKSYTSTEYAQFKTRIKKFPDLEQPKHVKLFGINSFIYVFDEHIKIRVSGYGSEEEKRNWLVSDEDFKICMKLEDKLSELSLINDIDRSVEEDKRYISKTYYSEQLKIK